MTALIVSQAFIMFGPPQTTVAEFLAQSLVDCGVTHVFGGHGGAIVPLIDAICAHPELTWVYMRCEVNASQAAAAFAKLRGGLGCCIGTSGPGASHLLTGLIDANMDRVPMLVLTGMKNSAKLGYSDFQDIDQASIFRAAGISFSENITSPKQVLPLVRDAVSTALTRSVCVHLAVAVDVQQSLIVAPHILCASDAERQFMEHVAPDDSIDIAVDFLVREKVAGRRTMICVGWRGAPHGSGIVKLGELLDTPILTTLDAKGSVPEDHRLACGVIGVYGNPGTKGGMFLTSMAHTILSINMVDHTQVLTNSNGVQTRQLVVLAGSPLFAETRYSPVASVFGRLENSLDRIAEGVQEALKPEKLIIYKTPKRSTHVVQAFHDEFRAYAPFRIPG